MRQTITEGQWIKVALQVNKVVNVTAMIDVEGAARDLAVAWIQEAQKITKKGLEKSK